MALPVFSDGHMLLGRMLWKHILTAILLSWTHLQFSKLSTTQTVYSVQYLPWRVVNDWNHINDSCYYDSKHKSSPDGSEKSLLNLEHQALY